jgi:hypothetical protein
MKLMTDEIERLLPPLGSTDGQGERAVARAKYFTPWSGWTWYATEYDPAERLFFGKVVGLETELGYFGLDELASVRGPGGLRVERDEHFEPRPLSECT